MDARDTFKVQQKYYYDFSFFPIRGLKKHNYFSYKGYKPGAGKLKGLFENIMNPEVLDLNCIMALREKILKYGLPLTAQLVSDLQGVLKVITKLAPLYDRQWLLYMVQNVHNLQRTLISYDEAQRRIVAELKKLLHNSGFNSQCRTSAEDIDKAVHILEQLKEATQSPVNSFRYFNRTQPEGCINRAAIDQAQQRVQSLVDNVQKLLQVQQIMILQLRSWKRIRAVHELQQVLN